MKNRCTVLQHSLLINSEQWACSKPANYLQMLNKCSSFWSAWDIKKALKTESNSFRPAENTATWKINAAAKTKS